MRGSPSRRSQCPSLDPHWDNPDGVPIDAFVFGARRSDTIPLVVEATTWEEGVYKAATMGSETTAAATGTVGEVRRDPFAMLPFCGYHVGDYFAHWLTMGKAVREAAARSSASTGSARTPTASSSGRASARTCACWPGSSSAATARGGARETALGFEPDYRDLNWTGLDFAPERFAQVMRVDAARWARELASHDELFAKLGAKQPAALAAERAKLGPRLAG